MDRSLAALSTFLGKPSCHTLVGETRRPARVAVYWSCGCVGSGLNSTALALAPCGSHRPRRIALAQEHVPAA